jgi:hypothetical protein
MGRLAPVGPCPVTTMVRKMGNVLPIVASVRTIQATEPLGNRKARTSEIQAVERFRRPKLAHASKGFPYALKALRLTVDDDDVVDALAAQCSGDRKSGLAAPTTMTAWTGIPAAVLAASTQSVLG